MVTIDRHVWLGQVDKSVRAYNKVTNAYNSDKAAWYRAIEWDEYK